MLLERSQTFQGFQNLSTSLSSCERLNEQIPAGLRLALAAVYLPGGNSLDAPPVLLNSSASASAADPRTPVSCWGAEETFCLVLPVASGLWILSFHLQQEFADFQIESGL